MSVFLCKTERFVEYAGRLEGLLGRVPGVVLRYVDVGTIAALEATYRGLRSVIKAESGPVIRSAALKRFPLLRAQLADLPRNVDFKKLYARHLALEKTTGVRRVQRTSTTLEDYVFFCQVETDKGMFAYALRPETDDGGRRKNMCFRTTDALDASILRFWRLWLEDDDFYQHNESPPRVRVTCLRRSTGEQAFISESCDFGEYDGTPGDIPYEGVEVTLKDNLRALLEADPFRDHGIYGSVQSQIDFICPSYSGYSQGDEEPQLNDAYLSFTVEWVPLCGEYSYTCTDSNAHTLNDEAGLLLLENAIDFV